MGWRKTRLGSRAIDAFVSTWSPRLEPKARRELRARADQARDVVRSREVEQRCAWLAIDWLIRDGAPVVLGAAGFSGRVLRDLAPVLSRRDLDHATHAIKSGAFSVRSDHRRKVLGYFGWGDGIGMSAMAPGPEAAPPKRLPAENRWLCLPLNGGLEAALAAWRMGNSVGLGPEDPITDLEWILDTGAWLAAEREAMGEPGADLDAAVRSLQARGMKLLDRMVDTAIAARAGPATPAQ